MADEVPTPEELAEVEAAVDAWLVARAAEDPMVAALERGEPGEHRWYLRVQGVEKEVFTIWWTLRQRTLHYETYVMPHPEEHRDEVFELLLRRNALAAPELAGVPTLDGGEVALADLRGRRKLLVAFASW